MGLIPSQNPYFVNATPIRPLTVSWNDDGYPVEIWERRSTDSPPKFKIRNLNDEERTQRKMRVPIKSGEVYTAVLFEKGSNHPDPNQTLEDPPPRSIVTVVGVRDDHKDLISLPDGVSAGGTYIYAPVTTSKKAYVLLQVGTRTPVDITPSTMSDAELKRIITPDAEAESFGQTFHSLECKPLIPGENYFYVIFAIDEEGYWDCKFSGLNCKWRYVEVNFKTIHIKNDGDPGSVGEASFWVSVYESGTSVPYNLVRQFQIGDDKYEVTDGQDLLLPTTWTVTIGPKKIDPNVDRTVGVHTNALEYDGAEGTEKAGSDGYDQRLDFPSGMDSEEYEAKSVKVRGYPLEDDDFEDWVTFDWKVTYSPAPP